MRFDLAVAVLSLALLLATGAAAEAPPAEPDDYRQDDFRSPVPLTLQGARVVDTDQVWRLLADAPRLVAVDVLPLPARPPRLAAGRHRHRRGGGDPVLERRRCREPTRTAHRGGMRRLGIGQ